MTNLVKLFQALHLENRLDLLLPDPEERPSHYLPGYVCRKRARKPKQPERSWKWGDEK